MVPTAICLPRKRWLPAVWLGAPGKEVACLPRAWARGAKKEGGEHTVVLGGITQIRGSVPGCTMRRALKLN